jgi:SAM-dependent methyltransferase
MRTAIAEWPPIRKVRLDYWKTRFRLLARGGPTSADGPDGIPMPGEQLRFLISGIHDYPVDQFLEMGRLCHRRIQEALRAQGVELDQLGSLLDFGCGCGRTIRNFAGLKNARLEGTDYNPVLIGWCAANLRFARFGLNRLAPPMAYPDGGFDLVYAFSVFTHFPEPLQHAWMAELKRILKPGGYLALSTMPRAMLPDDDSRAQFAAGNLVVLNAHAAGANHCIAFHPMSYMKERLAVGFDVLEFVPDGVGQDFWLLRKRTTPPS